MTLWDISYLSGSLIINNDKLKERFCQSQLFVDNFRKGGPGGADLGECFLLWNLVNEYSSRYRMKPGQETSGLEKVATIKTSTRMEDVCICQGIYTGIRATNFYATVGTGLF